jgi:hypothetical protein
MGRISRIQLFKILIFMNGGTITWLGWWAYRGCLGGSTYGWSGGGGEDMVVDKGEDYNKGFLHIPVDTEVFHT